MLVDHTYEILEYWNYETIDFTCILVWACRGKRQQFADLESAKTKQKLAFALSLLKIEMYYFKIGLQKLIDVGNIFYK